MNDRLLGASGTTAAADPAAPSGLLGDTPERDYSRKLRLFNAFAEPELRLAIAGLALAPGSFDLIWSVNTINHLRDPAAGLGTLATLLRPGGRIAMGQSSLLPDQYFAWDSRLERLINEAVHRYYEARYGLTEWQLRGVRNLLGWMQAAGLTHVTALTSIIERVAPLKPTDEAYLLEAVFCGTWGERLRPYLASEDYAQLRRVCDPAHPSFALHRRDFHFIQTFTLIIGEAPR